jgi:preprotein translocase subunit SecE
MAMNRQQKRMLQRQGQLGPDGEVAARKRPAPPPTRPTKEQRANPAQFVREVRGELRKVAWPTRSETINYSIIVLVAVVLLTSYVAALDYGFGDLLLKLFKR